MSDIEDHIRAILLELGEDPERQGLQRTPQRVEQSLRFLTQGYQQDAAQVIGAALFNETHHNMVLVRDIEFYSLCEHHMLPFFGKAHVAYIPNGRIVGLSKMARIVDVFARRLQVQERMTDQIVDALEAELHPAGRRRGARRAPPLHDDARRREAGFEHHHVGHARVVPRRPAHPRGIPAPGSRRTLMQVTFLGTSAAVPTVDRNVRR